MNTRPWALACWMLLLSCGIFAWIVPVALADAMITSQDGQVVLTIRQDGSINAFNKETNKQWQFPPADSEIPKAKNYQTTFAPKSLNLPKAYGRALYILYGNVLYCINGDDGKFLWTNRLAESAPEQASFKFTNQNVEVNLGNETRTFDLRTGKKLK